jgi:hypothetical protein
MWFHLMNDKYVGFKIEINRYTIVWRWLFKACYFTFV